MTSLAKCSARRIEPRHIPTRVTFFATPAGGRVRHAAGGRTYSAATTVDGRVFKWGLNRTVRPSRGDEHITDEEGSDGRGDHLSEADEVAAVQVSVPCQVDGIGIEVSGSTFYVLNQIFTASIVVSVYHRAYTPSECLETQSSAVERPVQTKTKS